MNTEQQPIPRPSLAERIAQIDAVRESRNERGLPALVRLIDIAYADHGGAQRVRAFLLGLYNGSTFKFDLTDLRMLDLEIQNDVLDVLAMDMNGQVEVHHRVPGVSEVIAIWAQQAWDASTGS